MLGAASTLIREWAESLLGFNFSSLSALARYLVKNLCVDSRSLAAICILCAATDTQPIGNDHRGWKTCLATSITSRFCSPAEYASASPTILSGEKPGKLREAQLQLQRKLQQREHIREQKHRHNDAISQVISTKFPLLKQADRIDSDGISCVTISIRFSESEQREDCRC